MCGDEGTKAVCTEKKSEEVIYHIPSMDIPPIRKS
jgi:hypothetical protein